MNTAGAALKSIEEAIRASAERMKTIGSQSETQSHDSQSVVSAMDNLTGIAEQNAAAMEEMAATIKKIGRMGLENIIQGHGDIILRGEIEAAVRENLNYLANIRKVAKTAARRRAPQEYLDENNVEGSGKSRVNLSGLAEELHRRNLRALLRQERAEVEAPKKK